MSEASARPERLAGVGCDVEDRCRLAQTLARSPGFLERWFTPAECTLVATSADPTDAALRIFCVKEAVVKAVWHLSPLAPSRVEALPVETGLQVRLLEPVPGLRLQVCVGGDVSHAWAEALAFLAID